MAELGFTARAERDFQEIGDWIARDDPAQARHYLAELRGACEKLTHFPEAYPAFATKRGKVVRKLVFGHYLILYSFQADQVTILRIVHGARDLRELTGLH